MPLYRQPSCLIHFSKWTHYTEALIKRVIWFDHIISCAWGLWAQALKKLEGSSAVIREGRPVFVISRHLPGFFQWTVYCKQWALRTECFWLQDWVMQDRQCSGASRQWRCSRCGELSRLASYQIAPKLPLKDVLNKLLHFCSDCSLPYRMHLPVTSLGFSHCSGGMCSLSRLV